MKILWDIGDGEITGHGGWIDGESSLTYRVEPTGTLGQWIAFFDGCDIGQGHLSEVLAICEKNEPSENEA